MICPIPTVRRYSLSGPLPPSQVTYGLELGALHLLSQRMMLLGGFQLMVLADGSGVVILIF